MFRMTFKCACNARCNDINNNFIVMHDSLIRQFRFSMYVVVQGKAKASQRHKTYVTRRYNDELYFCF